MGVGGKGVGRHTETTAFKLKWGWGVVGRREGGGGLDWEGGDGSRPLTLSKVGSKTTSSLLQQGKMGLPISPPSFSIELSTQCASTTTWVTVNQTIRQHCFPVWSLALDPAPANWWKALLYQCTSTEPQPMSWCECGDTSLSRALFRYQTCEHPIHLQTQTEIPPSLSISLNRILPFSA